MSRLIFASCIIKHQAALMFSDNCEGTYSCWRGQYFVQSNLPRNQLISYGAAYSFSMSDENKHNFQKTSSFKSAMYMNIYSMHSVPH